MTDNTHGRSTIPAHYTRADAGASPAARIRDAVVPGRQALIDQALRGRAKLLGKLNRGARQHLRELSEAIGESDPLGLD